MPVPDPPFSTPRIMKVLEPSAGQYEVVVRMAPTLASKFPDKPFGTAITAIGLVAKDSAKYPGYTLVAIEPADKGGKDHLWIFQKLNGPEWTTTSKSKDNLTPAKYRGQTTVVKTDQEVDPATQPTALTGDLVSSVVTQTPNTGKAVLSEVTETITENAAPLLGEEYGDIVTKSVSEILVADGTPADTGQDITESVVDPIGNGKSIRRTKRVKGGVWPDPLTKEVSKQGPGLPPERYRKDVTVTKTSKKIAAAAIPAAPTLSGDQVSKQYVKETPDRAEETTTTQTLTLTTSSVDQAKEQKPFVTITSTMTPGSSAVLPATGNGSARLVYENGATKIYENTKEEAVARPGPAGTEKDTKPFVTISTAKRFDTTNTIGTLSGSANVVFNDGATQIYEVSEVTSTGRYGAAGAEQQTKPFVSITSTATYQADGTLGSGEVGSTNKIYDDGLTVVYEKKVETAVARPGPAGAEKDSKPFVTISTAKRYAADATIGTLTGSANVVFNDGAVQVYEVSEVTSTGKYGSAGSEQQTKPFVAITSTKTYQSTGTLGSGEVGSTNKIYDDGTTIVYEKSVDTAVAREGLKGVETDAQPWGYLRNTSNYTTNGTPPLGSSTQIVYSDGVVRVYEQTDTEATVGGTTKDVDPQQWGSLTWAGTYSDTDSTTPGDKSKQVWSNGVKKVFLNETPTVSVSGGTKEVDANAWGKVTWTGTFATGSGGDKSRQVTRIGDTTVFLNETAALTVSGTSKEVDANAWGKITWSGTYSTTSDGDKSRQVYSGPGGSVHLNETAALTISGTSKDIDANAWGSVTWDGTYGSSTGGVKSRQVYNGPGGAVYLNETPTVTTNGSTVDLDSHEWGQVKWNGTYASAPSGDRSKQVWSMGTVQVYLNETAELLVNSGSFTSAEESNPVLTETQTSSYALSSSGAGGNRRSRVVFSVAGKTVYENITITRVAKGSRTYAGVVNVDIPPVFSGLNSSAVVRKDGASSFIFAPTVTAGYRGPMPCEVTETWSEDPTSSVTPTIFRPSPMNFDSPIGGFSVGACLHGAVSGSVTVGSNHKIYALAVYPYSFGSTTPAALPGNFIAHVDSQPYRDGYITRVYKVTLI